MYIQANDFHLRHGITRGTRFWHVFNSGRTSFVFGHAVFVAAHDRLARSAKIVALSLTQLRCVRSEFGIDDMLLRGETSAPT